MLWLVLFALSTAHARDICSTKLELLQPDTVFPRYSNDFKEACNNVYVSDEYERLECVKVSNNINQFYTNNKKNPDGVFNYIVTRLHEYITTRDRANFVRDRPVTRPNGLVWGSFQDLTDCVVNAKQCNWFNDSLVLKNGKTALENAFTKMCAYANIQACTDMKTRVVGYLNGAGTVTEKFKLIADELDKYFSNGLTYYQHSRRGLIEMTDKTLELSSLVYCFHQGDCEYMQYYLAIDDSVPATANGYDSRASLDLKAGCNNPNCNEIVKEFMTEIHDNVNKMPRTESGRLAKSRAFMAKYYIDTVVDGTVNTWGTVAQFLTCKP